jgi:hypothetical protein
MKDSKRFAKLRAQLANLTLQKGFLILSFASFFISLWLPAFNFPDHKVIYGILAALFGFLQVKTGPQWFANPLIAMVWTLILSPPSNGQKSRKLAIGLCSLCLALGLSTLMLEGVVANEGGVLNEIESLGIGFWFWITSFIFGLLSAWFIKNSESI